MAALSVSLDVSLHSYRCVLDMYDRPCLPLHVFLSYRWVLDMYDRPCLPLRVFLSYRCVLDMYGRPCLPLRVFLSYRCVLDMYDRPCLPRHESCSLTAVFHVPSGSCNCMMYNRPYLPWRESFLSPLCSTFHQGHVTAWCAIDCGDTAEPLIMYRRFWVVAWFFMPSQPVPCRFTIHKVRHWKCAYWFLCLQQSDRACFILMKIVNHLI